MSRPDGALSCGSRLLLIGALLMVFAPALIAGTIRFKEIPVPHAQVRPRLSNRLPRQMETNLPTFLYITEVANSPTPAGAIEAFSIDETSGELTPVTGSPFGVPHSLLHLSLHPTFNVGYAVAVDQNNTTFTNNLLVFTFDSSGAPTLTEILQIGKGIGGFTAVDPSGKFVYLSVDSDTNAGSGIATLTVQSDGTLSPNATFVPTDTNPGRIALDAQGRFLYTDTSATNKLWGFSIARPTGVLTPIPGFPVTLQRNVPQSGKIPASLAELLDPAGQRLFVVDNINGVILTLAVDQTTGAVSSLGQTGPIQNTDLFAPVMDPLGRGMFIGLFNVPAIVGFALPPAGSGTLTLLNGTPTPTSGAPNWALAIEPTGNFLYSVEDDALGDVGSLDGYVISQTDGSLTRLRDTPRPLFAFPTFVVAGP